LFPDDTLVLDTHPFIQSTFQAKVWEWWREFWDEFVPSVVHDDPYDFVFNADAIDGVHHGSVSQMTHNLTCQREIAHEVLSPEVERCRGRGGRYYHIAGTEAHVGKSAAEEEALAKDLGAKPADDGRHARWDLWIRCGKGLVHFLHHIGTTGSQAYEATAVHKELIEEYQEAARWRDRPPDIIVRSHRHRYIRTAIATDVPDIEEAQAVVTPGWQGKTPFVYKIPGGRLSRPQFGGIVIRQHPDGILYVRPFVRSIERSRTE
jgi:hypothetical protein